MTCECSTAVNDIIGSNKVGYEVFFLVLEWCTAAIYSIDNIITVL